MIPNRLLLDGTQRERTATIGGAIRSEESGRDTPGTGSGESTLERETCSRSRVCVVTPSVLDINATWGTGLRSNETCRNRDKNSGLENHNSEVRSQSQTMSRYTISDVLWTFAILQEPKQWTGYLYFWLVGEYLKPNRCDPSAFVTIGD
jgi:hypothetical protein